MLRKITLITLLIILNTTLVLGFHFKPLEGENEYAKELISEALPKLLSATSYTEDDLIPTKGLILYGEEETAFNIFSRMKKFSVDKELLLNINYCQNIALVKILVKNGTLPSIDQLPIISMNAYSELPIKEPAQVIYKEDKKYITGINVDIYSGIFADVTDTDEVKIEEVEVNPKDYYFGYVKFLEAVTTYTLIEKYPSMARKYVLDYTTKYGFNPNFMQILIDVGDYKSAIDIGTQFESSPFAKELLALAYAKSDNLEKALEIMNESVKKVKDDDNIQKLDYISKANDFIKLAYIYKYASDNGNNQEKIEEIENEILIIENEAGKPFGHTKLKKGDIVKYIDNSTKALNPLIEIALMGVHNFKRLSYTIGFLDNTPDMQNGFNILNISNSSLGTWDRIAL